jgi:hypothetical protein
MPISKAEYVRRVRRLISNTGRLEGKARSEAVKLLRTLKRRIDAEVANTDFAQFQHRNIRRAIKDLTDDFSDQYKRVLDGLDAEVVSLQNEFHQDLQGFRGRALGSPILNLPQLEVVQGFRAELIQKMSDEIVGRVSNEINLGVLAGKSPNQVMNAIRPFVTPLTRKDGKTIGALARSEVIARTEVNRVFNMTAEAQIQKDAAFLNQQGEPAMKIWVTARDDRVRDSHADAGRRYAIDSRNPGPIPVDEPFIVGGARLMFPNDPAGPPGETIQCRCVHAIVAPDLIAGTNLDTPKARKAQRQANRNQSGLRV